MGFFLEFIWVDLSLKVNENADYLRLLDPAGNQLLSPVSSSCPAKFQAATNSDVSSLNGEDAESIRSVSHSKDRQKKDNHNISKRTTAVELNQSYLCTNGHCSSLSGEFAVERKRRDNINNLIKELRTLLPHSSDPYVPANFDFFVLHLNLHHHVL